METQVVTPRSTRPALRPEPSPQWPIAAPRVDIYESDEEILLLADLPGVTPDAVRLDLDCGELTLEGLPAADHPLGAVRWRRAFLVPRGIKVEDIRAELKDGVLEVTLPKSEALRKRAVQVTGG